MKEFKKYYILPATPEEVYIALTNPITLEIWTGDAAQMSTEPGSEFSLWDDNIVGKNLEFEENKKLVQHWYFEGEPEDSIVTIKLHPHKHGTSMEVKQTNIPDEAYEDMVAGWDESYVGSLVSFFEEQ
ncbi:SRPBCC domain-containing protein [Rufibacter sp. LB8]|uniref:SRPBCC domain-containing protein n=1 Tax=Rufibacter sp. LB8 TaxID=2777781 RepID=UPI00178C67F5|nr:SRPBCC domain-containing protein [Rufibacter sp. LB8]